VAIDSGFSPEENAVLAVRTVSKETLTVDYEDYKVNGKETVESFLIECDVEAGQFLP